MVDVILFILLGGFVGEMKHFASGVRSKKILSENVGISFVFFEGGWCLLKKRI